MPPVGFEPTISAGERPQTYVLDRVATGTGIYIYVYIYIYIYIYIEFFRLCSSKIVIAFSRRLIITTVVGEEIRK